MKTLLTITLSLLSLSIGHSQVIQEIKTTENGLALTRTNEVGISEAMLAEKSSAGIKTTGVNANYINLSNVHEHSSYIRKFQNLIALYNIENSDAFNDNYDGIYQIKMKTKSGYVNVYYNNKGEVLETFERYTDVAIPSHIITKVLKTYPDWAITSQICEIKHVHNKANQTEYEIHLKKDTLKKKVYLDGNGNFI